MSRRWSSVSPRSESSHSARSAPRVGGERRWFIAVVLLALAVIVATFLMRPGKPERATDDARPSEVKTSTAAPTVQAKATKTAKPSPDASESADPNQTSFPGLGTQPGGIGGSGENGSLPKHSLTVRLSGPRALGYVAYIVPTSTDKRRGQTVVSSSSWSLSTTVYGPPDYAVVFVQAGVDGRPVSCEITVDGKVTERRSTEGPYGAMWCQG